MLRLVLNIFFMSFHRLGITRVSFSLSLALCMLPFNIYNPYKSGLFFISFWAWMRMEGARQGGIGQGSTNGSYKRFQDAMLPLPSGVICLLAIQWTFIPQGILHAITSFCSQASFRNSSDNILCSALDYSMSCQCKLASVLILLMFPDPF